MTATDQVLRWLEDLRGRITQSIAPYFGGLFVNAGCHLPAIEYYEITAGSGKTDAELDQWRNSAAYWLRSLGFDFHRWQPFHDEDVIFSYPSTAFSIEAESAYRLCKRSLTTGPEYDFGMGEVVEALVFPVALLSLLEHLERRIQLQRHNVFGRLYKSWHSGLVARLLRRMASSDRKRIGREISLASELRGTALLVERLGCELLEDGVFHNSKQLEKLVRADKQGEVSTLSDNLMTVVSSMVKKLRTHLELARMAFSDHLSLRNIDVNLQLQRRMLWLTLVAVVLGVAATWEQLKTVWSDVSTWLSAR